FLTAANPVLIVFPCSSPTTPLRLDTRLSCDSRQDLRGAYWSGQSRRMVRKTRRGTHMEEPVTERTKFILDESQIPAQWYNMIPDLPAPPPPPLHPGTHQPVGPD